MQKVSISQLKNGLSAYLKKVRAGQSLLILDRNEPIAVLERVDFDELPEGRLARLTQSGIVRRSTSARPQAALADSKAPKTRKSVVAALIEERGEGR